MSVQCRFCEKDINPHDISTWKEATGYVGGPKKDSMVLRIDTGRYACTPCIHKLRGGQAPDQAPLFDDVAAVATLREKGYKIIGGPKEVSNGHSTESSAEDLDQDTASAEWAGLVEDGEDSK